MPKEWKPTEYILIDSRNMFIPDLPPHMRTSTFTHVEAPFPHKAPKAKAFTLLVKYNRNVKMHRRSLICLDPSLEVERVFGCTKRRLLK